MYIISIIRVVQVHRVSVNGEAQKWYEKVFDFLQTLTPKHLSDLNQVAFLFRSVRSDKAKALASYLKEHVIPVYAPRSDLHFEREEVRRLMPR